MSEVDYNIRTALISDRSRLANLIHFGSHIHQHLDWKSPLDWIGSRPYPIIELNAGLVAALACPPELPDFTWIRLFAISNHISSSQAWRLLWGAALTELTEAGVIGTAALSLQGWFNDILETSDFRHTDNVIVLMSDNMVSIPLPNQVDISIRPMGLEDLPIVAKIDNSAFSLEWANSIHSLELAFQQSSFTSVAEMDGEIVGYQFSTISTIGGHLARLAVKTDYQGKGIGYCLVYDVLTDFRRRGVLHITVNTQQSNQSSIALYARAGFKTTGESYRVYQYNF
jgi:[ribosomal protein S18]-alanine N-acetyltransferase